MSTIGPTELIIIVVVLLLLFGPSRLEGLGAAAGRTIREFRKGMSDLEDEIRDTKPTKPSA